MRLYQIESINEPPFPQLMPSALSKVGRIGMDPKILYANAIAEDSHCDMQATIIVLFADDLLQRFGHRVLGKKVGLHGFGPLYRGVHLTSLLRATTNCVRHVSEWEDLAFPYPEPAEAKSNDERVAIGNIKVLQTAYGIGKHERIRDFVSWHTVVTVDGLYGTHPPAYQRFEDALVEGARDIAREGGGTTLPELETALARK